MEKPAVTIAELKQAALEYLARMFDLRAGEHVPSQEMLQTAIAILLLPDAKP